MSQSRKQAILEGVERQRRRNRVISISAIVIIAIVIVTIVITLPKSNNTVPLPGYLDHCVVGSLLYHSHPGLQLTINGSTYPVPPDVGRSGACDRPIHTHPSTTNPAVFDGTLHV